MIISQTPCRVSLAGGGTDMPAFIEKNGYGRVVSFTIDKYVYVLVKKRFDNYIYLKYSDNEIVHKNDIDSIKHDFIRETLKYLNIDFGVEIINWADISTKGSGIGSSSSFLVGLLHALAILKGIDVTPLWLARTANYIEIFLCKKNIGYQDAFAAAYGGLRDYMWNVVISETKNLVDNVRDFDYISSNMLLIYTGVTRSSSSVLDKQSENIRDSNLVFDNMKKNLQYTESLIDSINKKIFYAIGDTMKDCWELKKTFSDNISNAFIDNLIESCYNNGAGGVKIAGAGGGGYLVIYAKPQYHENIIKEVSKHKEGIKAMPFKITPYGSKIMLNTDQNEW